MSDDLVVHGSTKEEPDTRLNLVLFKSVVLTFTSKTCLFGVEEVEFFLHRLICKGIEPGVEKFGQFEDFTNLKRFVVSFGWLNI